MSKYSQYLIRRFPRRIFLAAPGAVLGPMLLAASVPSAAEQIDIRPGGCGAGVHLTAKGARLSDVLERLSKTLAFDLHYESANDPIINVDVTRPAPELVAKLSPADNVMVTQGADPRCPRHSRVVKVWVLPQAKGAPGVTYAQPAAAPPKAATPTPAAPQWTPSQLDEMAKKRKDEYDAYVRQHGVPPPPPPED